MRGILPSPDMTQPFCVIVVHDKTTNMPIFGLTNYGIGALDSDTVLLAGVRIPLLMQVNDLKFKESRPSSLGAGLHRRECTFSIVNNGPFAQAPFTSGIYAAGSTTDSFFFSLWVNDFSKSIEDMYVSGMHLGYFDLDAGLGWDETSLVTSIHLIDRLTNLTGRYNQITETAENLLAGSEWQRLLDAPAYLGFQPKVQAIGRVAATIGGFDSYNKGVLGVIAGLVQSSTLSGTSIQLGKSPVLATLVGTTVKLKMGNGCIITGAITDLTGGNYGINTTGMVVGDVWDTVLVYNKGWTGVGNALLPGKGTDLTSIFLDNTIDLTKIPSPTMYVRSAYVVTLYNGGPVVTASPLFCKLTGIKDEANKQLGCTQLLDPSNTNYKYGGVSVTFDTITHTTVWTGANIHLNFAKWLAKQTCGLYFTPNTYLLADVQVQGMPWELIVTPYVNTAASTVLTFDYIIRLAGNTQIAEDATGVLAIYADDGKSLNAIPNTEITSITYSSNVFGLPDACHIVMNRRLTAINAAYDENFLYIDTSKAMAAADVATFILDNAGIPSQLRDYSLRSGTNAIGNAMGVAIKSETWTQLLDTVVFEGGIQIDTQKGFYLARTSFNKGTIETFNCGAAPTQTFQYVNTDCSINFSDIIDGTYKMDIGRLFTNIDSLGREFVRTWYKFQYPYSNYGGLQLRILQSTKAAKNNDRVIDYTFKYLLDTLSATAAAVQMMQLGHAANIPDTTRTITVGLPFKYINLQVLDSVVLQDFRHITRIGDPLPKYDDTITTNPVYSVSTKWGPLLKYDASTPYALIPGVGIVDTLEFNFSGSGVPITFTFKQVQPLTTSNLKSVADHTAINTSDNNITATATNENSGGATNTPGQQYPCPQGTNKQIVIISSGEVLPSGVTVQNACCNVSSTTGNLTSDPQVTVICTGDCTTPKGCNDDVFPNDCIANTSIWHEFRTGSEINSTDPIVADIYAFTDVCPVLVSIDYAGKTTPDMCVTYSQTCHTTPGLSGAGVSSINIGTLVIPPCIFNTPEGMYNKTINLKFTVVYCESEFPPAGFLNGGIVYDTGQFAPRVLKYKTKTIGVSVPVSLRPVSDMSI